MGLFKKEKDSFGSTVELSEASSRVIAVVDDLLKDLKAKIEEAQAALQEVKEIKEQTDAILEEESKLHGPERTRSSAGRAPGGGSRRGIIRGVNPV